MRSGYAPMATRSLVFCDCETSSLDWKKGELVEVAAVRLTADMTSLEGKMHRLVKMKEPHRADKRALEINKYDEALWQKHWSDDGLSNQWADAGPGLLRYVAARPEYATRFRKLGSYLATKILVADLRHWLAATGGLTSAPAPGLWPLKLPSLPIPAWFMPSNRMPPIIT